MATKILLTGKPGCGKTTLVKKVLGQIPMAAAGFYTQEIRAHNQRVGFELVTLDGQRAVFAHVGFHNRYRVSKYGIDLEILEKLAVGSLRQGMAENSLVVIDEIGPMEILSPLFQQTVIAVLESPAALLGTIARRRLPFSEAIKSRSDIELIEVRPDNRNWLVENLAARFST